MDTLSAFLLGLSTGLVIVAVSWFALLHMSSILDMMPVDFTKSYGGTAEVIFSFVAVLFIFALNIVALPSLPVAIAFDSICRCSDVLTGPVLIALAVLFASAGAFRLYRRRKDCQSCANRI